MPTMTTSLTDDSSDTIIAMDTDVNEMSSSPSDRSSVSTPKKTVNLNVKFEFWTTKNDFDFVAVHREIAMTVANKYADTTFLTNQTNLSTFDPFSNEDEDMNKLFNYHLIPRTNYFVACFAHRISTSATFDDIKKALKNVLEINKGFIRINKWNEKDLDIVNAGWILQSNPVVHHREYLASQIKHYCEQQ